MLYYFIMCTAWMWSCFSMWACCSICFTTIASCTSYLICMCFNYSMCWTACSSCSTTTSTWTMREGKISWTLIPAFQLRTSTGSTIIANILYTSSIYTTLGTDIWSSNVFKCLPWCTSARSRTTRTCSSTCTVFC